MSTTTPRPAPEPSLPVVPQTDRVDAVQLTDLHKSFGDVTAVDGIDLVIRPGEVVALLGPNGAGKTTTIDMILGLSSPTSGNASVFGMRPRQAVDHGRCMPGADGLSATARLLERLPATRVLIVTTFGRPGFLRRAVQSGATALSSRLLRPRGLRLPVREEDR